MVVQQLKKLPFFFLLLFADLMILQYRLKLLHRERAKLTPPVSYPILHRFSQKLNLEPALLLQCFKLLVRIRLFTILHFIPD